MPTGPELPILNVASPPAADRRLPRWLKRRVPKGNANHFTANLLDELQLETVCDNARCPNRMECYSQKTATFMILGNICTRACGFCSVPRGTPEPPAADEPERVAEAAARLGLRHVVITSVTRDDLPDGGADHFARCVLAVRQRTGATIEVLTPDFIETPAALEPSSNRLRKSSTTTRKPFRVCIAACAAPSRITAGRWSCCAASNSRTPRSRPRAA